MSSLFIALLFSVSVYIVCSALVTQSSRSLIDWALIKADAPNLVRICDELDSRNRETIEYQLLSWKRYFMLVDILKRDRNEYLSTVSFLSNRIPRTLLPNIQDVPLASTYTTAMKPLISSDESGDLIDDCVVPNMSYSESVLDKFLLSMFRKFVQREVDYISPKVGILGLLDEGRHYMLSENGTRENQHLFVKTVTRKCTPIAIVQFFRLVLAGVVPSSENGDPDWLIKAAQWVIEKLPSKAQDKLKPGTQLGPLFYAPFLTSLVTPPFLTFLVGPVRMNRRKDGSLGGMIVEKCKFLQESNCKGLCLHQCKLPTQEFFVETLRMPVIVIPNFETQECQWSFGEEPLPPEEDPAFPSGCLKSCTCRSEPKVTGADACDR